MALEWKNINAPRVSYSGANDAAKYLQMALDSGQTAVDGLKDQATFMGDQATKEADSLLTGALSGLSSFEDAQEFAADPMTQQLMQMASPEAAAQVSQQVDTLLGRESIQQQMAHAESAEGRAAEAHRRQGEQHDSQMRLNASRLATNALQRQQTQLSIDSERRSQAIQQEAGNKLAKLTEAGLITADTSWDQAFQMLRETGMDLTDATAINAIKNQFLSRKAIEEAKATGGAGKPRATKSLLDGFRGMMQLNWGEDTPEAFVAAGPRAIEVMIANDYTPDEIYRTVGAFVQEEFKDEKDREEFRNRFISNLPHETIFLDGREILTLNPQQTDDMNTLVAATESLDTEIANAKRGISEYAIEWDKAGENKTMEDPHKELFQRVFATVPDHAAQNWNEQAKIVRREFAKQNLPEPTPAQINLILGDPEFTERTDSGFQVKPAKWFFGFLNDKDNVSSGLQSAISQIGDRSYQTRVKRITKLEKQREALRRQNERLAAKINKDNFQDALKMIGSTIQGNPFGNSDGVTRGLADQISEAIRLASEETEAITSKYVSGGADKQEDIRKALHGGNISNISPSLSNISKILKQIAIDENASKDLSQHSQNVDPDLAERHVTRTSKNVENSWNAVLQRARSDNDFRDNFVNELVPNDVVSSSPEEFERWFDSLDPNRQAMLMLSTRRETGLPVGGKSAQVHRKVSNLLTRESK